MTTTNKSKMWSSVMLAVIIFLNALVYFICQTVASTCLSQVIARFPLQVVSIIPFQVKRTTPELAEQQSDKFIDATTTTVEATNMLS